jgi:N-acyl-D-aspartate/D-glutamate deacylase
MLEHGVTTILMGNCSLSLAPVRRADQRPLAGMFKQIEDISLSAFAEGVSWNWETYPEYLKAIGAGLGINVAGLVGHSALRTYVMGAAAQEREANSDEVAAMCRALTEAIRGGAAGLSTSYVDIDENLKPVPSRWASRDEIIALGKAMKSAGRGLIQTVPVFYNPPEQLKNIDEMAEISLATGLMCSVAPIVHSAANSLWKDSLDSLEAHGKRRSQRRQQFVEGLARFVGSARQARRARFRTEYAAHLRHQPEVVGKLVHFVCIAGMVRTDAQAVA